jgi:Ca2+-binding RTX toxin-like protein
MATVTYAWEGAAGGLTLNDTLIAGDQTGPVVAALNGGTHALALWTHPGAHDLVRGRVVGVDNTAPAGEFAADGAFGDRFDASVATLANGGAVMTYTMDNGSNPNIIARFFDANGDPVGNDFTIAASSDSERQSAVTGLADGGFVVTWAHEFLGNDDLHVMVFNANGTVRTDNSWVNANANNTTHSAVAGLAGGGFVVAWEEQVGAETEVRFRRFDANGNALDGTTSAGVLIDTTGSINKDIQVVALHDGGFAVAYTDNGWNGGNDGTDITLRIFNADGTTRSNFIRVNEQFVAGAQDKPMLTVLSNGYLVVGWNDFGVLWHQAFDPNGTRLGNNEVVTNSVVDAEIAALANGRVINVRESTISDGSGNSIRSSVSELVRTTEGDGTDETLTGDELRDVMTGNGGNDVLNGETGDDVLSGGAGADELNGGAGFDAVSYLTSQAGVRINLKAGTASGGDAEGDVLSGIEAAIGSVFDDVLNGNGGNNMLNGDFGDDLLSGGNGGDTLIGGAGSDTASYQFSNAGVTINLKSGTASGGHAEGDSLSSIENLIGSQFDDVLSGSGAKNTLNGGAGDDTLFGGNAADKLIGSAGFDTVSYRYSHAGVIVDLKNNTATGGHAQGDTFSGIEKIIGSQFDDGLFGNGANNSLNGGAGDDVLRGGAGNDWLVGGEGKDTFVYKNSYGFDVVADYEEGVDQFDLSGVSGISSYAHVRALMVQSGDDVIVNFGGGNKLKILDTTLATLDANQGDFLV